jgi:hypothetical protein
MIGLKRRKGIVWVQPYGVVFPMRAGSNTDIACVQTLAGFEKILGRKRCSQRDLQKLFRDNREAFEALASFLYFAPAGEALTFDLTTADESMHAETKDPLGWTITVRLSDGSVPQVYNVAISDERAAIEAIRRTLPTKGGHRQGQGRVV